MPPEGLGPVLCSACVAPMTRQSKLATGFVRAAALAGLAFCIGCAGPTADRPLVIALPAGLQSTDVDDPAHEEFATAILGNVYETLVEVEPDLSLRPGLAESWHSPDDLTWVFTLRPGVRLHDGDTLTAAHVAESFERARRNTWMRGEMEAVSSVSAKGERDVAFSTRVPFSSLPARLTYFFVTGKPPAGGGPAPGTGPYRIRSSTADTTVLEASTAYRGGPASIRVVEFQSVPDARERSRRLRRGQVHLTADVLPEDMVSLAKTAGLRTLAGPGLRVIFLAMDCARARSPYVDPPGNPFRDRKVREAVALAIDRDALVAGPLHGYAEGVEQLPSPSEVGFDLALPRRAFDLSRARRLLAEAAPGGFDVRLDYMGGKYLAIDAVVEALSGQLARAGVRVKPVASAPAEYLRRVESHDVSLYVLGWTNESASAHETYASLLHSPRDGFGATNGGAYSNADLDALLEAVPGAQDQDQRVDLLRRVTRLVNSEVPVVPLYRPKDLYAFTADLAFEPRLYPRISLARLRWKR